MLSEETLTEWEQVCEEATPGPWAWRGHIDQQVELRALHSMGRRILTTIKATPCSVILDDADGPWQMGSYVLTDSACDACKYAYEHLDEFPDGWKCDDDSNMGSLYVTPPGPDPAGVRPINEWAVKEVHYRGDVIAVDHPDAKLLGMARQAIPELLAEVRRLQNELEAEKTAHFWTAHHSGN